MIINEINRLNNSADRLSICSAFGGMQMSYKYFFDSFKRIVERHGRADDDIGGCNDGLRWIINIDKDNLELAKIFLESGIQIRHIKNMPPMNFGVSDKEVALTIEKMEGGSVSQSFLISNEPLYVNHFNSLFEELWKNGIDAKGRITAIEQGLKPEFLEVITDNEKASHILVDLAKSVKKEALFFLPNDRALLRMERLGVIDYLIHASQNGVEVKIICCLTVDNSESVKRISSNAPNIRILNGDISPYGMLIVDGEKFLMAELREPTAVEFSEAIGFAIYLNSKRSVESFKSVFELLWNERKLNEELKRADKMQKEFINIAAHELRNPIQPILRLTEILRNKIKDTEQLELLNATIRSAKRLQRLSEDILDVTRIESQSLNLKKEPFNLSEMILNAIADSRNQLKKDNNIIMKLTCMEDVFVEADKARLNQVIANLLSNAVNFTQEGIISIIVEKKNEREGDHSNQIVVSIKDTGTGIDPEIFSRLFGKFVTKSEAGGVGLGLFISKSHCRSPWRKDMG
jgi:signal transduction histidine kinase